MITHPSFTQLNDYADRELPEKARARVSGHLARCTECRSSVMSIRNMSTEADRLSELRAPEGALGRILERYAAGERVILPVADPVAPRVSVWGPRRAAVAAAIVLAAMASVFSVDEAGAERSSMEFLPVSESNDRTLEVDYISTSQFTGVQYLVVRSRFREAGDQRRSTESGGVRVGRLLRDDAREFRGTIQLPASAVYSVFAVEDESGENIDHNGGGLWEYLKMVDGRPTHEALVQKQLDLIGRDWEAAHATAWDATNYYPDSPEAWSSLIAFGELGLDVQARDDLWATYTEAFDRLDELLANETASPDQLAWMHSFARRLESAREPYWRNRLVKEAPTHEFAVQERVFDIQEAHRDGGPVALSKLEGLWEEVGEVRALAAAGHEAAVDLGDIAAIERWVDRWLQIEPTSALPLAEQLMGFPALSQRGLAILRERLRRMDEESDVTRALYRSGLDHRIRLDADRRGVLTALGRALIEAGNVEGGLDTLRLAVEKGWEVDAFSAMAEVYLSLRETSGAAAMLANLFVDPSTPPEMKAEVAARARALPDAPSWEDLVAGASAEMHRRTMAEAVNRALDSDGAMVADVNGQGRQLSELVTGQVTLVVFSTRFCPDCINALPDLDGVLRRIRHYDDVNAMIITGEELNESGLMHKLVAEEGIDIPVYYDTERAAHRALNAWETPGYFVLDKFGHVRFSANSFEEVVRQVEALRATEGA